MATRKTPAIIRELEASGTRGTRETSLLASLPAEVENVFSSALGARCGTTAEAATDAQA